MIEETYAPAPGLRVKIKRGDLISPATAEVSISVKGLVIHDNNRQQFVRELGDLVTRFSTTKGF